MCTAKSEGGQRCYSNVKEALEKAHGYKVNAAQQYLDAANEPRHVRENALRRGLLTEHAYEDALAQYASTDQGRADLEERLKTARAYHHASTTATADEPDDAATIKMALMEGKMLADRAAETKRAVRAGEMSEETALKRTEYPNDFARDYRARTIDATVTRILGPSPTFAQRPVRHLQAGDVLNSGFVLTRRPYTSTRLRSGRLYVEGHFPGKPVVRKEWGASTNVYVQEDAAPAAANTTAAPATPVSPAPTVAQASADTPEQIRYRDLFEQRNNLTDTIYARTQNAEDAADAHEIGELDAQLAAVEAEMESLETWRRR